MNDLDIKTLINSAVDGELTGHRMAPSWEPAALLERSRPARSGPVRSGPVRSGPARRTAAWTVPVLAASAAALLTAGSILAIDHSRDTRSNPVGDSAGPAPSVSTSDSVSTDLHEAARAYSEAVAGAVEATEAAGVSVGPLSARDAAWYKDSGLIGGDISSITSPEPGKTYSFTLSYLAGASNNPPDVLATEVQDVAGGGCAQPFLARPGHAYRISCWATLLAGATGKATLTLRTPTGTTSGSVNLTDSGSSSDAEPQSSASRAYSQAAAGAPEASEVAGVSVVPATQSYTGQSSPDDEFAGKTVVPGKSYSYPVEYVVPPGDDPVSLLSVTLRFVAAGSCPKPFLVRAGHAYRFRCQVTFLTTAAGELMVSRQSPTGLTTQNEPLLDSHGP